MCLIQNFNEEEEEVREITREILNIIYVMYDYYYHFIIFIYLGKLNDKAFEFYLHFNYLKQKAEKKQY